ncbi:MAG TPA: hypothetical protein VHN80_09430 [Kineosporiaceae bacterium]|nr:hypothetical protein [Kineosporiaceae bacterium]
MNWLVRLYPSGWRDRYGEEFADLIADVSGRRAYLVLVWDVGRGALDAHLRGRYGMRRHLADRAVRSGIRDGAIVAGLLAVLVVATNVVFPGGPDESDADPAFVVQYLVTLACLAILLITIGVRGGRRVGRQIGGAKAGATAGAVIATSVTLTFLVVNNLFLDIVSRQHDKRLAFASSGWTSMRAYLTVSQLRGAVFLIPALAVMGGVLGLVGAAAFLPRMPRSGRTSD